MTTIFLSSTWFDLEKYRRKVDEILRLAKYRVIGMESFLACDLRPVEKCLAEVEKADIYVGIFAFRYGDIPPDPHLNPQGLSATELELRHAEKLGKPRLYFMAKKDNWPLPLTDYFTGKGDSGKRITELRASLSPGRVYASFGDENELAQAVLLAVNDQVRETGRSGIVTASLKPVVTWDVNEKGLPYPGMDPAGGKFAPVFFGREREVSAILENMRSPDGRFVLVSGDSGVGKSSIIDAGVIPNLGDVFPAGRFFWARMVPSLKNDPYAAFSSAIETYFLKAGINPALVLDRLKQSPEMFAAVLRQLIDRSPDAGHLVLFLDQMEELFTADIDRSVTDRFLTALYRAAVEHKALWVLATIRADFLHHCHRHPDMLQVLNNREAWLAVGEPTPLQLGDMIVKPAQCAGLTITNALQNRIITDAHTPGSLPLLAFVLHRLASSATTTEIDEADYDAINGFHALRDYVAEIEKSLSATLGDSLPDILGTIFIRLVVMNPDGEPTRRRAPKSSFPASASAVIDLLIDKRLLHAEGVGEQSTVSIRHESLFKNWPTLEQWITKHRSDLLSLRVAEIQAGEWNAGGFGLVSLLEPEWLQGLRQTIDRCGPDSVSPLVRRYAAPQDDLLKLIGDPKTSHHERQKIGHYLGVLGDSRPGVGIRSGAPDIVWIPVLGGTVNVAGVEKQVKEFKISKYLVTNAQYHAFIDAGGYNDPQWWEGLDHVSSPWPSVWRDSNQPRTTVSWHEAMAFCRWLSTTLNSTIYLPDEWQWQQAATGGDSALEYPWGEWDASRCNSIETTIGQVFAVGLYPRVKIAPKPGETIERFWGGDTTQGASDMAGNVWEWCGNQYFEGKRNDVNQVDDSPGGPRVIRGGSYFNVAEHLRASFRYRYPADFRHDNVGFRLAQDLD